MQVRGRASQASQAHRAGREQHRKRRKEIVDPRVQRHDHARPWPAMPSPARETACLRRKRKTTGPPARSAREREHGEDFLAEKRTAASDRTFRPLCRMLACNSRKGK